jgi:beta-mannosidase
VSEFGFQSFPSLQSLKAVLTDEEDYNVTSPAMEFRQRSPIQGNKAIMEHIARHFRIPSKFEDWIYLSQVLQGTLLINGSFNATGLSIKAGCEHWRRLMPYTMGTLYWQLNDIWQGK